jgi:hypothetical protein
MEEYVLKVSLEIAQDGKEYVKLYTIKTPDGKIIPVRVIAYVLTTALSMLIKSCGNVDIGIKDYDLMKSVNDKLQSDFIDPEAFKNANFTYLENEKYD